MGKKISMKYVGGFQSPHIKDVEIERVEEFKELGYEEVDLEGRLKAEGLMLKKKVKDDKKVKGEINNE